MKNKLFILSFVLFSCEVFIGCVSTTTFDYAKYGYTRDEIINTYGNDIFFHIESDGTVFAGSEPDFMAKKAAELGKHYFYILNGSGYYKGGAYHSKTTFNSKGANTTTYQDIWYSGKYDFAISNVCMEGANSVSKFGFKPTKAIPKWVDDSALKIGIEQFSNKYTIVYVGDSIDKENGTYSFEAVANKYNFLGCNGFGECKVVITVNNKRITKIIVSDNKASNDGRNLLGGCILKNELEYKNPSQKSIEEMLGF